MIPFDSIRFHSMIPFDSIQIPFDSIRFHSIPFDSYSIHDSIRFHGFEDLILIGPGCCPEDAEFLTIFLFVWAMAGFLFEVKSSHKGIFPWSKATGDRTSSPGKNADRAGVMPRPRAPRSPGDKTVVIVRPRGSRVGRTMLELADELDSEERLLSRLTDGRFLERSP